MIETLHKILLSIHIPVGAIALILFWIPVGVKKGSPVHKRVGWYYVYAMWIVLATAFLMCICNLIEGNYMSAMYLGFLSIITGYPLWYSYAILNQNKEWSDRYYNMRRLFLAVLFISSIGMLLLGGIKYQFKGMGTMMGFFGLLGIPSGRDLLMSKDKAITKESRMKMHIQGTIISGIAAYTAFSAFGGQRIIIDVLQIHHQWMIVPWILPTLLGTVYSKYMKRKYIKVRKSILS